MRGLRLLLAALTPLCNAAVYLSPNRLTAPPSIEQNIAETKVTAYKNWCAVDAVPFQSLRGWSGEGALPRQPSIVVVNVGKAAPTSPRIVTIHTFQRALAPENLSVVDGDLVAFDHAVWEV
ncbi:hypothetical protein T484DRAFT_2727527 [Baffinella frigidus]|nr:hypothetical protein T484DRAFT_2727527 [Cryptophyta sp. CCMP2293]